MGFAFSFPCMPFLPLLVVRIQNENYQKSYQILPINTQNYTDVFEIIGGRIALSHSKTYNLASIQVVRLWQENYAHAHFWEIQKRVLPSLAR